MKLAVSNIGWLEEQDIQLYELMRIYGFTGLEIAPTRVFPESPYDRLKEAGAWAKSIKREYGFVVPSMQSVWFGRQEKLFGTEEDRRILFEYTKKAIHFAAAIDCKNIVFGCPRNRIFPEGGDEKIGGAFFKKIGDYAADKGVVIGMEANPLIYNTNYINDTVTALNLVENINSPGFLLNLDIGTMIQNEELVEELQGRVRYINHVHISEPGLKPIRKRGLHQQLNSILLEENYQGFVSIEMGRNDDIQVIEETLKYVKEIFG